MRTPSATARISLAAVVILQATLSPIASADHFLGRLTRLVHETKYKGTEPATCQDCAIEHLAENIDWLEHYIDTYGSIVAKQPDIWGEARLTKHRDEYERIMFGELNQFKVTINAAITQGDSSFLAQAFALSSAAGGTPQVAATTEESTTTSVSTAATGQAPTITAATRAASGFSDAARRFGIEGEGAIQLEPVIVLDQTSRYLQHLHELRRINEGDDTSDSPGYSLNLVRIPVSILPGKLTREGFGAEITVTATPVLSDDLLPTTFRNLVVNDLVDQLGLPLVRTVENVELMSIREELREAQDGIETLGRILNEWSFTGDPKDREEIGELIDPLLNNKAFRDNVTRVVSRAISGNLPEIDKIGKALSGKFQNSSRNSPDYIADQIADFLKAIVRTTIVAKDAKKDLDAARTAFINAVVAIGSQSQAIENKRREAVVLQEGAAALNSRAEALMSRAAALKQDADLRKEPKDREQQGESASDSSATGSTESASDGLAKDAENTEAYNMEKEAKELFVSATNNRDRANGLIVEAKTEDLRLNNLRGLVGGVPAELIRGLAEVDQELERSLTGQLAVHNSSSSGRARRARHPLPPSQVVDVYGPDLFISCSTYFCPIYSGRQVRWAGSPKCVSNADVKEPRVNLLDAQKWLGAELSAAYELLSEPEHISLWYELARADGGLANAIRSGRVHSSAPACCTSSSANRTPGLRVAYQETIGTPAEETPEISSPISDDLEAIPVPTANCENWSVKHYRDYFFSKLHEQYNLTSSEGEEGNDVLDQLAWAIVVESALLNQRLNDDIRKLARAKEAFQLETGRDYNFFIPETVQRPNAGLDYVRGEFVEASQVFQEYVRVRWPIHVFAIDPREQDQNVADVSQRKREMQFALALGFATGKIGANSLTQYSRQLETQVETISLNRTIVGFGHGSDTFGWRFYPRVQALHVPGTMGVLRETFCGASRDYDLKHRQLEAGQRECVAVVLMPSFVPYADFDIRSNWFKLTNPKNAALTMKDSMRLSRAVTAMRNSRAQCAQCQHLYREGELRRLLKRVDQLDRELPLQTERALVPYENTLGGFEMFNTGVTDLAPELIGFYGAPGINTTENYQCGCFQACDTLRVQCTDGESCDKLNAALEKVNATLKAGREAVLSSDKQRPLPICEGAGTSLFLVGDNFSVHDTKVIAGGVCIPHVQLISRELMRVTIPSCVNTVTLGENGKKNEYVAIYVATPYGVTNHLHVPVMPIELPKETKDLVKSEVTKALEAMNIAPRPASITPGDKNNKIVKVTAHATTTPAGDTLRLIENGVSMYCVKYEAANDPSLWGKNVRIEASVKKDDQFIMGLARICDFKFNKSANIPALGTNKKLLTDDSPTACEPSDERRPLLEALEEHLELGDFPADRSKPLQLKIVYYALVNQPPEPAHQQQLATRLVEEVDLEVKLETINGNMVGTSSGNSLSIDSGIPTQRGSAELPAVKTAPVLRLEPHPASELLPKDSQTDCGCQDVQATYWRPTTRQRIPARFAQESIPTSVAQHEVTFESQQFLDRLDRIEASLAAVNQQVNAAAPSVGIPSVPEQLPVPAAVSSGTGQVTIRIIEPDRSVRSSKRERWFGEEHPLLNQMKIGLGEQWRDLRDQLPCY